MDKKIRRSYQENTIAHILSLLREYDVEEVALICKRYKDKMKMAETARQINKEDRKQHQEAMRVLRRKNALAKEQKEQGENKSENV